MAAHVRILPLSVRKLIAGVPLRPYDVRREKKWESRSVAREQGSKSRVAHSKVDGHMSGKTPTKQKEETV